ncbi:MAG: hypothetical protein KC420_17730 [Myxococcales bacterium]|nr:hypothetical protein [Myxococcales bacterium]
MQRPAPLLLALTLACTTAGGDAVGETPRRPDPVAAPAPDPTSVVAPDPTSTSTPAKSAPAEIACASDDECTSSCSQGAVNRRWYEATFPGGEACEDGCTSKGSESPRCEEGICVAYRLGARDPECTDRPDRARAPQRPGPAHRCESDQECRVSCNFGAIRGDWYGYLGLEARECKDGCASKGITARCAEGRCAAFRGDSPLAECTEVSVHRGIAGD